MREAESLLAEMTLEEKVGQMIQVEFDVDGKGRPSESSREMILKYKIGSVYCNGFPDPMTAARCMNLAQKWAANTRLGIPLLSAIDAESGHTHVSGATIFPMQMGLAATRDLGLVREAASITAAEGRAMGIHWNLSPVADVVTEPRWRRALESFGDNADLVSRMVVAKVRGYQGTGISPERGMMATAKHYPGHGHPKGGMDSHYWLPRATYSLEILENVHMKPFGAAIESGTEAIMTGHIIVEAVDNERPATLSENIVTGLLREKQGFDGIVITDAFCMGAITKHYSVSEAAVMAVKAGVDVLLAIYVDQVRVHDAIIDAVKSGKISENRIDDSVRRILDVKYRLGLFENPYVDPNHIAAFVGRAEHRDKSLEAARRSVTLVTNDNILPLSKNLKEVVVTAPQSVNVAEWTKGDILLGSEDMVQAILDRVTPECRVFHKKDVAGAKTRAKSADVVIVTIFVRHWTRGNDLSKEQVELIKNVRDIGTPIVIISLGKPYCISDIPDVPAILVGYPRGGLVSHSPGPQYGQAISEVLFGDYNPTGKLPVSISRS